MRECVLCDDASGNIIVLIYLNKKSTHKNVDIHCSIAVNFLIFFHLCCKFYAERKFRSSVQTHGLVLMTAIDCTSPTFLRYTMLCHKIKCLRYRITYFLDFSKTVLVLIGI